ncbi:MAG: hypothetical protein ACR2JK_17125 [Geodermatophilaceae bacterium]
MSRGAAGDSSRRRDLLNGKGLRNASQFEWFAVGAEGILRAVGSVVLVVGSLESVPRGLPTVVVHTSNGSLDRLFLRWGLLLARISPVRHE